MHLNDLRSLTSAVLHLCRSEQVQRIQAIPMPHVHIGDGGRCRCPVCIHGLKFYSDQLDNVVVHSMGMPVHQAPDPSTLWPCLTDPPFTPEWDLGLGAPLIRPADPRGLAEHAGVVRPLVSSDTMPWGLQGPLLSVQANTLPSGGNNPSSIANVSIQAARKAVQACSWIW